MSKDIELVLEGNEYHNGMLELALKTIGLQYAILDILSTKHSSSEEEADELFKEYAGLAVTYSKKEMNSLNERRGKIDLDYILGRRPEE